MENQAHQAYFTDMLIWLSHITNHITLKILYPKCTQNLIDDHRMTHWGIVSIVGYSFGMV